MKPETEKACRITPKAHPRSTSALSAIEILISVTIIAILASAATLAVNNAYAASRLRLASERLISELRDLRSHTLRAQQGGYVQFDPAALTYTVVRDADAATPLETDLSFADGPCRISDILLDFNFDQFGRITFSPDGLISPPGNIILRQGDRQATITLTAGGHIELSP